MAGYLRIIVVEMVVTAGFFQGSVAECTANLSFGAHFGILQGQCVNGALRNSTHVLGI